MSRIERQIIVWGEDRRLFSGPAHDDGIQARAGLGLSKLRTDQAARIAELNLRVRELTEEVLHLRAETEELRRMNRDLEASAELWIEMYERQLARANELASRLSGLVPSERR